MKLSNPLRRFTKRPPIVAIIPLHGVIGAASRFSRGLSDQSCGPLIEAAFGSKPAAVALSINSPGGSPVQSSLIAGRIRRLADKHEIPVLAFVEDAAASGGYWLACAADEIHADRASVVGSIGVIAASFGMTELIARYGVERRVHATGANKAFLDPFQPEDPEQIVRLHGLLGDLQTVFTDHVRARRGDKLREGEEPLFDGRVWTAPRAAELGIIDGIGAMAPVLEARFGDKVRTRVHSTRRGLLSRLGLRSGAGGAGLGLTGAGLTGAGIAADMAAGLIDAAEERALWARHGL
jgi:serine protease SohB